MTENDDVLMDLKTALRAEPSREFAAGVRSRVNRSRVLARRMWWGLAAAATVTLATVALWQPAVDEPAVEAVVSDRATVPTPAAFTPAPSAVQERVVANTTAPRSVRRATRVVSVASDTPFEPRLEVLTNQPAVLRKLWAGYSTKTLLETPVEVETPATPAPMKPLAPVRVDPIVVVPIVVSELVPAGRSGGVPVIRRIEATKETR